MSSSPKLFIIFVITLSVLIRPAVSVAPEDCGSETGSCIDKSKALSLKIIAIVSILVTSMIGVCSPLFSRAFPALHPDRDLFIIVKAFAAGIILGTAFMHVLPDSFDMLSSLCLAENPWHKFPFTGFVAMLSAILTLMVDSLATSFYSKKSSVGVKVATGDEATAREEGVEADKDHTAVSVPGHFHHHGHYNSSQAEVSESQLLRYRVVAMVS